jgi:hypothetical protein
MEDDKGYKCLEQQIKFMSVFYLAFSFMDLLILALADIFSTRSSSMFICAHERYLLPLTDGGAMLLLGEAFFLYSFSLIITHIFYKIPYSHGLLLRNVIRSHGGEDHLSLRDTSYMKRALSTDQNLETKDRRGGTEQLVNEILALNKQESKMALENQRASNEIALNIIQGVGHARSDSKVSPFSD